MGDAFYTARTEAAIGAPKLKADSLHALLGDADDDIRARIAAIRLVDAVAAGAVCGGAAAEQQAGRDRFATCSPCGDMD